LREYSIPHLRKSGRISIPEDSFDRIREARDLHKEGLATDSVRRQLREDTGELDRRLDRLHQTMEGLRGDIRERPAMDEVALSPTLRTILARQSLIMSAMFNLTGMVEDLLLASGKPRKSLSEDLGITDTLPERLARERLGLPGGITPSTHAVTAAVQGSVDRPPAVRPTDFGSLGRRRRRGVLAILAALLFLACLSWAALALIGAGDAESSVPRVTATANGPPSGLKAMSGPGAVEAAADGSERERGVEVPDVSGRSLEGAVRIISDAGFEVASIKEEVGHVGPHTAIRTQPQAGARAKQGAPVILTMSVGPTGAQNASTSASASASVNASAGPAN
jgi:hypothetical protein